MLRAANLRGPSELGAARGPRLGARGAWLGQVRTERERTPSRPEIRPQHAERQRVDRVLRGATAQAPREVIRVCNTEVRLWPEKKDQGFSPPPLGCNLASEGAELLDRSSAFYFRKSGKAHNVLTLLQQWYEHSGRYLLPECTCFYKLYNLSACTCNTIHVSVRFLLSVSRLFDRVSVSVDRTTVEL